MTDTWINQDWFKYLCKIQSTKSKATFLLIFLNCLIENVIVKIVEIEII